MAEASSRGSFKRAFVEDDDSNESYAARRVRFLKGKKTARGDNVAAEAVPSGKESRHAGKDGASKIAVEHVNNESIDFVPGVGKAEIQDKDDAASVLDEGVQTEPFNPEKEREDGYFDEDGKYVEYVNPKDFKLQDARLDTVGVSPKYSGRTSLSEQNNDKSRKLMIEELAKTKRRIADVLQPGETVQQGLRRLKGSLNDKKKQMYHDTQLLFDQLTDDALKLMDGGDYNVYEEKQERFMRDAGGYEKLVQARTNGVSVDLSLEKSDDIFYMFGGDVGIANGISDSNGSGSTLVSVQPYEDGDVNDYVYDDSSGYYYSSSLGYYYDPSSGFYCCAASGIWYSYNSETETYDEVRQDTDVPQQVEQSNS